VLHLTAVSVVNDIFKIEAVIGCWANGQNLIGADTKMPVSQKSVLGRVEL